MRNPSPLLAAALLAVTASAQTFVFRTDRWEVNDPFKMDTSVMPPKALVDPKKGIINLVRGTVERTFTQGGAEVTNTRKLSDVQQIIWPEMPRLIEARANVNRGEPAKALENVEPIINLFEPLKKVPGSLWLEATVLKLDALDRLNNDAALGGFLDALEKDEAASTPELATKIQLARLLQRSRRGEHESVIREADDLIGKMDDTEVLARLHIVKGASLMATRKYEAAMNTYLRVPVFYGTEQEQVPKAMLGAALAFRGMDGPAVREQKLEETSFRYLRDIIITYPVSKEADEARKILPKEEVAKAEAEQKKLVAAGLLPDGATIKKSAVRPEDDQSANR
ncbi:MAG: tetratricopeptide repeat protein [Opitutales bacterium]